MTWHRRRVQIAVMTGGDDGLIAVVLQVAVVVEYTAKILLVV